MTKNVLKRGLSLLLALCLLASMAACGNKNTDPTNGTTASGTPVAYTVTVKSVAGIPLSGVGVYIYEDSTMNELVWFDKTNENGVMTFTDVPRDTYVAVLSDVPTGYKVEDFYALTGENTEILLEAGQMEDVKELTYQLGDMMMDFSVTDVNGTVYQFSELLKQKKAVVLNFWYIACQPCNLEFPFLQEAYDQYSDDIALVAMNPMDSADQVEAFRKENGYTFPMVACDPQWEKIMQITAYPTTVVADRNGNIVLIHKGGVDNTKTFADAFAYFAADNYEQKLITDITELRTEEEEGSKDNPLQIGGQSSFEVKVGAGKEVYTDLYKALGMYMQIKGKDFKVLYNDKTYTPDSSGAVGFVITTGDTFNPAQFGIVNTGTEEQTYKVTLSNLPGTLNNPYTLKLGELTVKINAGNEQGVYYVYDAAESGTLTVKCLKNHSGVGYGFTLYNTGTMAVRTLDADGAKDENGIDTLSVVVNKGDRVQFIASTLPDSSNSYPGGTFTYHAAFEAGEGTDKDKVELVQYKITVTDEEAKPMVNVNFSLTLEEETKSFSSDTEGVAVISLPKGAYTVTMLLPEGYTAEVTEFKLTEEAPTAAVTLKKIVIETVEYAVTVVDPNGDPVKGALVFIGDDLFAETDDKGVAKVSLPKGDYAVEIADLPEGYELEETIFQVSGAAPALTVTVQLAQTEEPSDPTEPSEDPTEPSEDPTEPSEDPTEPSEEPTEPSEDPTEPSEEPTEPSEDPTEPSEDPTEPSEDPTEPSEDPTEPTEKPELPSKMVYSVTILDPDGNPVSGVRVQIKKGNSTKGTGNTDATGTYSKEIATGEYTVVLKFSTDMPYYYDESALVLTGYEPNLTVRLIRSPSDDDMDTLQVLNGGSAYRLYEGQTRVSIGNTKPYYSSSYGNNCFFIFVPERSGTYQISLSNNSVKLSSWATTVYQFHQVDAVASDNTLTVDIKDGQVGHVEYVIGLNVDGGASAVTVNCIRIGEAGFDISAAPWSEEWRTDYVPAPITLDMTGKEICYVDITAEASEYRIYYNSTDRCYHLDSVNGPVLYVNLGMDAPYVSFKRMIFGDGTAGGAPVRHFFYDENGAFVKKEDYTDCMSEFINCADTATGLYPLTEDLVYIIQNSGTDWWDPEKPTYLFKDANGDPDLTVNREISWMFAVCTID